MTSTPVNVQGFMPGAVYGTNRIQGAESKGDFSKIFENQQKDLENADQVDVADEDFGQKSKVKEAQDSEENFVKENKLEADQNSNTVRESGEANAEQSVADKDMKESSMSEEELTRAMEVLNGAVSDVKNMLMQELQISEEELKALMQECNLSDMDLLQLGNVKELMLKAVDAGDMTALLTNEGLYSQSKTIEAMFAEIMQRVETTLEAGSEEVEALTEAVNKLQNKADEPVWVEVVNNTEGNAELKTDEAQKEAGSNENLMQENNFFGGQNQAMQASDNVQAVSSQSVSYTNVEAENIMRQIMDHMQLQLNADSTEVNMQLQPETLGTLQIRISAKEGIMTAQFTTASETVKSILEAQMIQLQQQFDQQNIKVEAIEVTVQAHAFESALEKGNEQQAEGGETKRNRTRRIDLNTISDGSDEMETEDKILAEMMEVNGNTVDYLV